VSEWGAFSPHSRPDKEILSETTPLNAPQMTPSANSENLANISEP